MRLFFACFVLFVGTSIASAADKPNVVVILVDDMGFSDLGCYGSEIPTPNLDRLAKNGVRFTQFYNTARCCPTRAALLSGLYSHQAGVGHMVADDQVPGYRGQLSDSCVTIAEVLRPAGYFTAMTGKWHVGQNHGVTPWGRGFDRSLNAAAGGFYFSDAREGRLFLNGQPINDDDPRLPKGWYSTDLWTEFGLKFVDEAIQKDKPFYLHLCHNAPHFPLQAPEEAIAKFRGQYKKGWSALRQDRLARQREMGIVDSAWKDAPIPEAVREWEKLSQDEKDRFDHIMAVYAATVHRMDKAIGDLVQGLEKRGVLDNTLILFMSDNGGNAESGPEGRSTGDPTQANSNWFCGESWAFLQNTPFRKYKHFNHEGGIASPLIAHWPSGMKSSNAAANRLVHTPSHLIDIMATCVDVGSATYPEQFQGKAIQKMEGQSLRPLILASATIPDGLRDRALYWEHEGNAAIRSGDRKLVRSGRNGAWELYDMKLDRTEQNNLASSQPEQVELLASKWNAWAERAQVVPYPVKDGNKKKANANGQKKNGNAVKKSTSNSKATNDR